MNISNFFSKPATVTPEVAVTPATEQTQVTTPVALKKPGFFSGITSYFAGSTTEAKQEKHQYRIDKMMKLLSPASETLASEVFENIKGDDIGKLLNYHRDLNLISQDQAYETPTFAKFKTLLGRHRVQEFLIAGATSFATEEGGKAHAKKAFNFKIIEGMRKGLEKALIGASLSEADKQKYLTDSITSIGSSLTDSTSKDAEGTVKGQTVKVSSESVAAAKKAMEELKKIESDPVLGEEAKKGAAAKKLAQVKAQAEKTLLEAEKQTLVEGVSGSYETVKSKFEVLRTLKAKLEALGSKDDATVAIGRNLEQERNEISEQIIALMKEINPETTFSEEELKNPLTKNITKEKEISLEERFQYEADRMLLISATQLVDANKEFVERLVAIQGKKSLLTRGIEYFTPSIEATQINNNSKSLDLIAAKTKTVKAFEAKQKAIADAKAYAEANKDNTLFNRISNFGSMLGSSLSSLVTRKPVVSAKDQAEAAFTKSREELESFVSQDDVASVLAMETDLQKALSSLDKKFYFRQSRRDADKAKLQETLSSLRSEGQELFERYEALKTACNECLVAFEAAVQAEQPQPEAQTLENVDFVVA